MTVVAELITEVRGREVGLSALLARVRAESQQADQAGQRLAGTLSGTLATSEQRAANSGLQLAAAQARYRQVLGDTPGALAALNQGLIANVGASERATLGIQTQIARLESGKTTFQQFGDAAKNSLLSVVGPLAVFGGAMTIAKNTVDSFVAAFKFKAELDATTASINAQLKGVRDTSVVYAEAAKFANQYKLTQQETTEAIAASIGVMRNSKAGVEDILSVLARLQVLSPEQSLQEAAVAVKALASGDTTSLVTRFEVGRDVAGQMKREIAGGADAVAVLNKFLNDTGIGMDALKAKTVGAAGALKDVAIANEQLALAQAQFAQGPGLVILQAQIQATTGATRLLTGDFTAMDQSIRNAAQGGQQLQGLVVAVDAVNAAIQGLNQQQGQGTQSGGEWISTTGTLISSMEAERIAASQAGLAFQAQTQAIIDSANTSITDTAAKNEQAAVTALVAAQSQAAADAFIRLNPNVNASGAAAAASAAGFSPLIARLIEATLRANEARQALALFNALAGLKATAGNAAAASQGELDDIHALKVNAVTEARNRGIAAATAAEAAERRHQLALGNTVPALERARAELAQLTKGSAAYIDKQTEIVNLEKTGAKGRGGGAGAAKLTDQQRLNNTLLTDQERYQDQSEAAERDHVKNILKIQADYEKKSIEQQKANEISKRSSELDFLKSITSSELNETKTGRAEIQRINERFYADFAEAQKAAQAGNAKLSEDLVNQARDRAKTEQTYAEQIDQAKKDKDGGEVTRLEALREKERQILDEQRKQLLEGGDANAAAKQDALNAEDQRFIEQQDKTATAAEQAGQRKIDQAVRNGKAITDENTALLTQEGILNRIGPRQPGGVQAPAVPVGAAPATTVPTGTPVTDLASLADALRGVADQITAAIDGAKTAITGAQRDTTSAVKGLEGRALG